MNQLCRVCGEPAAGFHFGAFTCEGCKSFFGRTYNNVSSLGECKNEGRCVINKKNRTTCKSCRLRKCLVVGMSKSGSRYGRRSNWFKIHCLLQEQAVTISTALERNNNNLAIEEAKRSLKNMKSDPTNTDSSTQRTGDPQITIKEEHHGRESPNVSSPESHISDNSLESLDPRRTPTAFHLYPKLGALSPFLLHPTSALTSPTSPYSRLALYPYLYPVLSRASERSVSSPPVPTPSPNPNHRVPSPSRISSSSPGHLDLRSDVRSPASTHGREASRSPINRQSRTPSPPDEETQKLLLAHLHHVSSASPTIDAFRLGEKPINGLSIVKNLQQHHQLPPHDRFISPVGNMVSPGSPRYGDEADEQKEPIDLSVRRPAVISTPESPDHILQTEERILSYSMMVTTSTISSENQQETGDPVDLSCRV